MGLYGSGLSYASLGDAAIWRAKVGGSRAAYGNITTLIWVRDTTMASGNFSAGTYGGLGHSSSKAALATYTATGNFVWGVQQPNTGSASSPNGTLFPAPTTKTWVPFVTTFNAAAPYTRVYLSPEDSGSNPEVSGALSFDRVFLGDWNLSRTVSYGASLTCPTTTLMAEFAVWQTQLTATDMVQLFSGANPLRVRPDALLFYFPLNGNLLDYGPRGSGLAGPKPKFGPHPPVEPIRHHRLSGLRQLVNNSAGVASTSVSEASAAATVQRVASGASRSPATAASTLQRMFLGASISTSLAKAAATATRVAKGRLVSASKSSAKASGPKASMGAGTDASAASAAAVARRAAAAPSKDASASSVSLTASRSAAGSAQGVSLTSAAGGFVRSGSGSASSTSTSALRLSFAHAAYGVAEAVSSATAALVQTFASTAKQASGISRDASSASASGAASRAAAGASATASSIGIPAARIISAVARTVSSAAAKATTTRPAKAAASASSDTSVLFTVNRAALGASADGSWVGTLASGPRNAAGKSKSTSSASAALVASRAAAALSTDSSLNTVVVGHGRAAGGVSLSAGISAAFYRWRLKAASLNTSAATASALVTRQAVAKSKAASTAVSAGTYSQPTSGEWALLVPGANILPLRIFLAWRTLAFQIAPTGAVQANIPFFLDVGVQAEAIWTLLYDILNNQPSAASVQAAMDYGFAQQSPDGSFNSNSGKGAKHDINAQYAFVSFAARVKLLSQAVGSQWAVNISQSALFTSLIWFGAPTQITTATQQNQGSASGLISAASALLLGSAAYNNQPQLLAEGTGLLTQALALQNPAGWFNERGLYGDGWDAVYQGISIHKLAVICSYYPQQTAWLAALQSAVNWMKTKIYPGVPSSGWLNLNGSTRSNGQDAPFVNGAPPSLDLADVGFGMLLAGQLLNDQTAMSLGSSVLALYDATQSARDVIVH